jgi:hypothetical protein
MSLIVALVIAAETSGPAMPAPRAPAEVRAIVRRAIRVGDDMPGDAQNRRHVRRIGCGSGHAACIQIIHDVE